MKFKLSRVALTTMSLLPLLTACGGADNKDYQPKEKTLEVKAIDGYLNGAQVWLDLNGNGLLDSNEPSATTGAGGKAVLDVSSLKEPSSKFPLMVQVIANKTIDESAPTTAITQNYVMSAPAGYKVITPLTTLVQLQVQAGSSLADAEAKVKSLLEQESGSLSTDYLAAKNQALSTQAAALVQLLPAKGDELKTQKSTLDQAAEIVGDLVKEQQTSGQTVDLSRVVLTGGAGKVVVDSDGDSWKDSTEDLAGSDKWDPKSVPADLDKDGIADVEDPDIDGDGILNAADAFPTDRFEGKDSNNDGWGDSASSDDDGDGTPDSIQNAGNTGSQTKDPAVVKDYTEVLFHYKRTDGDYTGWGLHLWNNSACDSLDASTLAGVSWDKPLLPETIDAKYGAVFRLKLKSGHGTCINLIAHSGGNKGLGGGDQKIDINYGNDVYGFDNDSHLYYEPHETAPLVLRGAAGHWLTTDTLAIQPVTDAVSYELWAAPYGDADITKPETMVRYGLVSGGTIDTTKLPHLASWGAFQFKDGITADQAKALVKQQLIAVALDKDGKAFSFTKVQIPGVLDDLYTKGDNDADEAKLGSYLENGQAKFRLWAPTARSVELYLYNAKKEPLSDSPVKMTLDPATGIWAYNGAASLEGVYYRYRLQAFHPVTNKVEWLTTTDPYSLSLSTASRYSQLVDLNNAAAKPEGWDEQTIPAMAKPEDNVVYELHVRDFSSADTKGTKALNGKYLAFTEAERDSVQQLKSLREAGLTTIELMPTYDIDTIPEEASRQVNLDDTVARLCEVKPTATSCAADSTVDKSKTFRELLEAMDPKTGDAQALLSDLNGVDGFNWGYDPYHYTTPEGSYAVNSEGLARIKEYRSMILAMHKLGYRVVQDVVYNHTNASGLFNSSVLDKTVPGYYHRLNPESGSVETSTCCQNTASEHRMFEKLVADSMVTWTDAYKIDGFRMDLMEHLMKSSVEKALAAIQAIRPDSWIYGEGWNFGEVANGARGVNATQFNLAGTGIGTFNDRLRDAVRGGGPFDGGAYLESNLGFANAGSRFDAALNSRMDLIRIGMAGNLQDYAFTTADGTTKKGVDIDYGGVGAGYTKDPQEAINYVEKHDNQTLWDIIQYKAATDVTAADRARMEVVGQATVLLGQGVPFMHMGSELLRSKSMNRDSYDSGDWFNKVDFSKQTNNWNVGLPRADKDVDNWPYILKALENPNSVATPTDIAWSDARIKELLKVRSTTELLRLGTADDIIKRVKFYNTGADYVPGVIMMGVDDGAAMGADLDANYDAIMVAINANTTEQTVYAGGTAGFELHPVFAASSDEQLKGAKFENGKFTLPPLSAVVFVKPQAASAGTGLDIAPLTEPYYLRGVMNDWGTSQPLTYVGQGRYQVKASLTAKTYEFKFANSGWDKSYGGYDVALASSSFPVTLNSGNLFMTAKKAGEYTFTLDVSQPKPVLNVIAPAITPAPYGKTAMYLKGGFNGWGTGNAMPYTGDNGLYQTDVALKAGSYEFKIADADWAGPILGYSNVIDGKGAVLIEDAGNGNLKITIPSDGEWQFVLDANDPAKPTLTIQQTPNYTCYKNGDKACDLRMYQVMVESFVNGDDTINYDTGYGPSVHKGDLQGIINSLDYIKSLNVNALWLTPVFNSCADTVADKKLAATGYFACDYFTVDPKFGDNKKLKDLVDAAHAKGLYVFLDGVFGHTITDAIPAAPVSKVSPVMVKAGTGYTVDYTQANSVTFFKEVATHYVTEYGIDGWRLDQAYQVPPAIWTEIRTAVEAAAAARKTAGETWGTLGYMVGEVWKGSGEISSQAYGPASAPALKSAFDFPLRYGLVHALAVGEWMDGGDATHLNTSWNSIDNYPMHAMPNLMISNHDLVRFGDLLERSGLVTGVEDPAYWLRNKAALSFMAANSGPITLYYGDEIGDEVPGFSTRERNPTDGVCVAGTLCRDDDNIARSDAKIAGLNGFVPSTAQADLKAYVTKLMEVRAANPALYGGKRISLAKSATLYVDLKQTLDQQIVYLLNTGTTETTYDLSTAGLKGTALLDLVSGTTITDLSAVPAPALTGRLLKVVTP